MLTQRYLTFLAACGIAHANKCIPSGCADLQCYGHKSRDRKSYTVYRGEKAINVSCDFVTDGGGWTVLLRRNRSESVDFNRSWNDYITGFGDPQSEFWVGLDPATQLIAGLDIILRHDVITSDGSRRHAIYTGFRLGSARNMYRFVYAAFNRTLSTMRESRDQGLANNI
ncbi:hypothetical protein NP493_1744g00003 [Ridgeia piscesae]|uniref:Fibrinogen C-terminal domain-containing protein n=1 Tax=Ridgeia piscesae TaxID=27915 RepID=A0AAD9JUY3_RIDPI|nr:hypothetical protein NP493_1744g00003 [Ridgeia piscesae]